MISFQEYNIKSPLNGLAAKWADSNSALLPVDNREIAPISGTNEVLRNEKIVIDITSDDNLIPDFKSFFHEIISTESSKSTLPAINSPRLDFGSIAFQLKEGKTSLGRSSSNVIIIPSGDVSLFHCEITYTNEAIFYLKDCGSTNGTFLNGSYVVECIINHLDRIQIGNIEFQFLLY